MPVPINISRTFAKPTRWEPKSSYLLLKPTIEDERTSGGIILPDATRKKPCSGFIVKMGVYVQDYKIGDEVFFEQHQETRVKLDDNDEEAILLSVDHVLLHYPQSQNVTSHPPDRELPFGPKDEFPVEP